VRGGRPHTIKTRITMITVLFSLMVALFLSTLSYVIFGSYALRSVIQSAEFNLQIVAGVCGQELIEANALTKWASTNTQIAQWLAEEGSDPGFELEVYDRLREEFWNNRSRLYIRRFIVADADTGRFLQTGNNSGDNRPVTSYNLDTLSFRDGDRPRVYEEWSDDPYTKASFPGIFPVKRPIRSGDGKRNAGYVYLSVSAELLFKHLRRYPIPRDCALYLSTARAVYRMDSDTLVDVSDLFNVSFHRSYRTFSDQTRVGELHGPRGTDRLIVSCPLGIAGMSLAQTVSTRSSVDNRRLYAYILAIIVASMLLFGLVISFVLGRIITRPVLKIRERLAMIASSDFTRDQGIEWDNELGDIGRGVNDMSGKIESLMESRLADEGKKRDLEYRMLQSQINPHFLYNTLGSIKWMATIQNATGIAEMTTALARLMKNVIKGSRTVVPLRDELALLDDYFIIQRYRYGGAIRYENSIPEELLDVAIPCFVLQPLMENAIFHGIEPKGGVGTIRLRANRNERGDVEILMTDDGVGMEEGKILAIQSGVGHGEKSGMFMEIGIGSVDMRIRHSFGDKYGLRVESQVGVGSRVLVILPYSFPEESSIESNGDAVHLNADAGQGEP